MSVTHVNLVRLLFAKVVVEMSQNDDVTVTRKREDDPPRRYGDTRAIMHTERRLQEASEKSA